MLNNIRKLPCALKLSKGNLKGIFRSSKEFKGAEGRNCFEN